MDVLPLRQFGHTGDHTTVIGLGGAVLTRKTYQAGVQTVRRAYELGVRYFDTSPGYCGNRAQPALGDGQDYGIASSASPESLFPKWPFATCLLAKESPLS